MYVVYRVVCNIYMVSKKMCEKGHKFCIYRQEILKKFHKQLETSVYIWYNILDITSTIYDPNLQY